MFGAIPIGVLIDLMKMQGWMEQLSFDFPPVIYIKPEFVTDVPVGYSWDNTSTMSNTDHPAFTALRESLGARGYIKIERGWWNGDIVLKPFYLNNIYFEEGEQFPSGAAMKWTLKDGTYIKV